MRQTNHAKYIKFSEEHRKHCIAAATAAGISSNEHNLALNQDTSGHSHSISGGGLGTHQQTQQINQLSSHHHHQTQQTQAQQPSQLQHLHIHPQSVQTQFICATTGLPLDPQIQMSCGLKTPVNYYYFFIFRY